MDKTTAPILLWDIDGTLLAAGDGGLEHFHRALAAIVPGAAQSPLDTHGKTDWQIILELLDAAGVDRTMAEAVSAQLDANATVFIDEARAGVLLNVPETLSELHERGLRNGLLTGNSERRSRLKLTGAGLDSGLIDWGKSYFGSRSPDRPGLAKRARAENPSARLLIIGDTPHDGMAALAAGIPFLALCTGKYRRAAFDDTPNVGIFDELTEEACEVIADKACR